ncbi:cobalamin B12-binding domain-containing protein [Gudongella sp. SC589]|jgi:methanogenic corrinoid protein MtbC1|uniref:cobalamin B12-binding domain-containing protein n=1 Tax=Gudongella sp. SC589 TaxID=3385990 RepID=UPI0039048F9B
MNRYYDEFMELFSNNWKNRCVIWSIEQVEEERLTIPELYSDVLVPALYSIDDCPEDNPGCIWDEHVKTSIIRTIIETLYPTVIKLAGKAQSKDRKIVLACPENEYHEIGLRIMADFFQINGYDVIYIGSNTPRVQIWEVIKSEKPDYVGISVTDYYLLSEAKKIIERIRLECTKDVQILLGGQAFRKNPHTIEDFGGDFYIENYEDVLSLGKGEDR